MQKVSSAEIIKIDKFREIKQEHLIEEFTWSVLKKSDSLTVLDIDCIRDTVTYLVDCGEIKL